MTPLVVLLGVVFGFGLTCAHRALTTDPAEDSTGGAAPTRGVVARLVEWATTVDRLALRFTLAAVAFVGFGVLTQWPVGMLLGAAAGFFAPSITSGKAQRELLHDRLDAIATWTEQLRDVMAAAAGLEQAVIATAPHAPLVIRAEVRALATALQSGTTMRPALRRFAHRLDDPAGDLVVAALVLAAEGSPRHLGDLLGRLAATTRETVRMRLRVETGRARTRSSVRVVTSVTVLFSTGIVLLNPTYTAAYRSLLGQAVLVVVAMFFAGAYWWLTRASHLRAPGRFLGTDLTSTTTVNSAVGDAALVEVSR